MHIAAAKVHIAAAKVHIAAAKVNIAAAKVHIAAAKVHIAAAKSQPGKYQKSKIEQFMLNKSFQSLFAKLKTVFGLNTNPKTLEQAIKRLKSTLKQDCSLN